LFSPSKTDIHSAARPVMASAAPNLREASFDDYPQVALLQAERGMRVRSHEKWRHLWKGNPAYLEMEGKWPIGWVLEAGSKIVGYVGNIPERYELNGRRLTAACGYSWVIAHAYSAYSLLLLHEYLRQESADLCLSTSASPQSYKAHVALGALPVPAGVWDRSSVWITNYEGFVASWLERKRWPMPGVISYPISAALSARDAIRHLRIHKKSTGSGHVKVEFCDGFDERFDSFWQALRAESPNALLADRSRQALEWHFRHALLEKKLWVATVDEGSGLCAYAIFRIQSDPADSVQRVVFIDFQSTAKKATLFYPVLERALERCCATGIHVLQTVGLCPRGVGDISLFAPYKIRQQTSPYLYKALDRSLAEVLSDPQVWVPSLFDGDATV
jgi:hypothetical protein